MFLLSSPLFPLLSTLLPFQDLASGSSLSKEDLLAPVKGPFL